MNMAQEHMPLWGRISMISFGLDKRLPQNLAMYINTNVLLVVGDVISKYAVAGKQKIYVTKQLMGHL